MGKFELFSDSRSIGKVELPHCPQRGDIISHFDYKDKVFLVERVEFFIGEADMINLYVKEFANQAIASLEVDGYR